MQVNDDRDLWLGLGFILGNVRFRVNMSVAHDRATGYRVRSRVVWSEDPPLAITGSVMRALDVADLELKEKAWERQDDLLRWVAFVQHLDNAYGMRHMFADQLGLQMFLWVFDNPPPNTPHELAEWAEAFDEEEGLLKASLLKEIKGRDDDEH